MFLKDGTVFCRHYVCQHCSADKAGFIPQRVVTKELRSRVLRLYHERPGATHLRVAKMKFLIAQQFMWYRSGYDVEHYVRRCNNCAKRMTTRGELQKRKRKLKHQQMGPVMHQIQMELVESLKPVLHDGKEMRYILMIGQRLTRFFVAIVAIPKTDASTVVARALYESFISYCGVPTIIYTDRRNEFKNKTN